MKSWDIEILQERLGVLAIQENKIKLEIKKVLKLIKIEENELRKVKGN